MSDVNKMELAKQVYETLCKAIENREWKYDKDENELEVDFIVGGDDIPMQFIIKVDADRQLIRLFSPIPFSMSESKRIDGAIATCAASFRMADGNFDYDITDGSILFRMTVSFIDSVISESLFQYMISCACTMVDEYNDKFFALNKGMIEVTEFLSNN